VAPAATAAAAPAAAPAAAAEVAGTPLKAPMPGMIVKYQKSVGDAVTVGETVVVLEAMKMENALPATVGGTIKAVNFASGDSVQKNDVLAVIG
jgi:pyruvate carboxylase subunit B